MSLCTRIGIVVALALTGAISLSTAAEDPKPEPTAGASRLETLTQAELERRFSESLSGAVFSGSYSVASGGEEKPAQMEKYTITRVTKQKDDRWLFAARIQYGKTDITVPMVLQVKWAGDTPVITLTDLTIPGLGTF